MPDTDFDQFQKRALNFLAATELVGIGSDALQYCTPEHPMPTITLSSLLRGIVLLEMAGRIPELGSLDLLAILAETRTSMESMPQRIRNDWDRMRVGPASANL